MRIKGIFLMLFFINFIFAGFLIREYQFSEKGLKVSKIDGYDFISLEGCDARTEEVGEPIIPFKNINFLIPPTAEIVSLEILAAEKIEIPGSYYLYPAQLPRPIGEINKEYPFIYPKKEIYESDEEYPKDLYKIIKSGCKSGFRIGGIFLFPLRYIPKERKLILYKRIKVKINYEEGKYLPIFLTPSQKELFSLDLKYLVENKEDIERFSPPIRRSDNPDIDYVILTDTNLVSSFIHLRNWLRKTGYWAEIRTKQWVCNNYPGRDLAEKIRNFIKDYFQNHGLKYVLLGGDGDHNNPVIPTRQAGPLEWGGKTSYIACDLYYADLDWSWDGDNDNKFGEWGDDTVDLYHDIYIGRIPVENSAQVINFTAKLFIYLTKPDTTYQKKLLLPAAFIQDGHNYMRSQDSIESFAPAGWIVRKLDQGRNTSRQYEVRDSINQKFHFVHLVAHGDYEGSWIRSSSLILPELFGRPQYHRDYTEQQTNHNALCIINAISCLTGAFDLAVSPSCLAESALNATNCAIGVIMNTRLGWLGASEFLDWRFYDHFFTRDSVRFAPCHQSSKEIARDAALNNQGWRWCYYELTLFGEPSMFMWKDYPKKMIAYFPRQILTGSQVFPCTVKTLTGNPVGNALVTLWKENEVYEKGYTNSDGIVNFNINPTTAGNMYVTATKPNYIPYMGLTTITIGARELWVRRYNGPGNDYDKARAIAVDNNGNVYVTGVSWGQGTSCDYATIKYNSEGQVVWVARYNGPGNYYDEAYAIAVDNNGNVYVTGYSWGQGTSYDYATIKYNSNGQELWVRRYNGPGNGWDEATAIAVDNNGNVYVTGYSEGQGTSSDYATIKYNSNGQELWVARYNGPANYWDDATAIAVDNNGNVYVTGESYGQGTSGDYATIKYNSNGQQLWVARYNYNNDEDVAYAIAVDNNGNVYVTGYSHGQGTFSDYATIKYSAGDYIITSSSQAIEEIKKNKELLIDRKTIYTELPKDKILNLKIYNTLGKIVYNGKNPKKLKELPTGIYFLQMETKEKSKRKIVIVR